MPDLTAIAQSSGLPLRKLRYVLDQHLLPGGQHAEVSDDSNFRFIRLEFDGDVLVGSNTIGHTEHVGILRGLTQSGVKLGAWKEHLLRDPLRLPEAYLAAAQSQHAWGLGRA